MLFAHGLQGFINFITLNAQSHTAISLIMYLLITSEHKAGLLYSEKFAISPQSSLNFVCDSNRIESHSPDDKKPITLRTRPNSISRGQNFAG